MEGNWQAEKENIKLRVSCYFSWSLWLAQGLSEPPSLVEVKSVDFTDDVWVRAKNHFMLQSAARELPDAVSFSAWVSELKLATRRRTSRILLGTHARTQLLLYYIYYFNTIVWVQACMFLNTFVIQRKKPPKISQD